MLTQERAELLVQYLTSDEERTERLSALSVEEVVGEINKEGHDFTVEELRAFGEGVIAIAERENGELNAEQLQDVAGGWVRPIWGGPISYHWALKFAKWMLKWFK